MNPLVSSGRVALVAALVVTIVDCARHAPTEGGDDEGASAAAPAPTPEGSSPPGGVPEARGGGASGGGAGGAPTSARPKRPCPLDDAAKASVRGALGAALDDARWLARQGASLGAASDRAFGATVPFTRAAARFVVAPAACTGERRDPETCDPPGDAHVAPCRTTLCPAAGTLVARARLEPTPSTLALADGSGTAKLDQFELEARFEERPSMLTVAQTSRVGVEIAGASMEARAALGATLLGTAGAPDAGATDATSVNVHHELELRDRGVTVVTDAALSGDKGTGQLVVGTDVVGAFDEHSFDWVGPCAP
jgi:hypothetical protein